MLLGQLTGQDQLHWLLLQPASLRSETNHQGVQSRGLQLMSQHILWEGMLYQPADTTIAGTSLI